MMGSVSDQASGTIASGSGAIVTSGRMVDGDGGIAVTAL